ncbi:MAG: hypothetical protein U0457_13760 [Candidatus Sericytochromatia bacterium]
MELNGNPPSGYIAGALPDKVKNAIKEGVENVKKHPEVLGTGNPEVLKPVAEKIEGFIEHAAHEVKDFFKETFDFVKKHPETLAAKTEIKIFKD